MNHIAPCGDQWANTIGERPHERAMNNTSMFTADRMTHLKIVVVSLVCATLVAGIGVAARVSDTSSSTRLEATVIKAGAPVQAATTADGKAVR
jgi:ABC-type proline/glycine betaine transport system permease subunit